MTKVKSINSVKRAGKVPEVSKEQAVIAGKKLITATRNGKTRTFSTLTWGLLPPDKDGWQLSSEKPADLKPVQGGSYVDTRSVEQIALDNAIAAYKAKFGTDPEEGQTTEDILDLINDDEDESNFIEFEMNQEYLDTHPEVAAQGIKVGDVYKTKKEAE